MQSYDRGYDLASYWHSPVSVDTPESIILLIHQTERYPNGNTKILHSGVRDARRCAWTKSAATEVLSLSGLDIHPSMIKRWKGQLDESGQQVFPGKGNPRDEEMARLRRELKRARRERHPKKGRRYLQGAPWVRYPPSLRYRFMEEYRGQFSIAAMARVLEVSTSGYYNWRRRKESRRSLENRKLMEIKMKHAKVRCHLR